MKGVRIIMASFYKKSSLVENFSYYVIVCSTGSSQIHDHMFHKSVQVLYMHNYKLSKCLTV